MRSEEIKASLAEEGFAIVPDVLSRVEAENVLRHLWKAAEESELRGVPTRNVGIDPNDRNVRVFNLIDLDPLFRDLIANPLAIGIVSELLSPQFLISNFT